MNLLLCNTMLQCNNAQRKMTALQSMRNYRVTSCLGKPGNVRERTKNYGIVRDKNIVMENCLLLSSSFGAKLVWSILLWATLCCLFKECAAY